MSFTADIYKEIQANISKEGSISAPQAMRKITEKSGIDIVYAMYVSSGMRAAYFSIGKNSTKKSFPKWKGIDIQIVTLPAYGNNCNYVGLTQLPQSETYIFEIVIEDLRSQLAQASSPTDALPILYTVLAKWKDFFLSDKDLLLSPERQQGLYGELLFLEECLADLGNSAVSHWAGSNDETHDFYIASNAVEVKTTGTQAPYAAHISSEYQLDGSDVPGRLFLRFYAFRKSQSTGEKLPEIVARIRQALSASQDVLQQFNAKVKKYGYLDEVSEHYTTGYFIRDHYYFGVIEGFPRIIKKEIAVGISDLSYSIAVSHCMPFALEKKDVFTMLKGGTMNA